MFKSKFDSLFNMIMEDTADVINNTVRDQEGYYQNYTGKIKWGETAGYVTDATFMLKSTDIGQEQPLKDVYFYDGSFDRGVFVGYFCGGTFKGGTFKAGQWINGIFAPDKDWRMA